MGIFEYAASILSIVLGLAVAHLLGGVAWIIRAPKTGSIFWVFSSWCFVMLLVIIGWWWSIWTMFRGLEELSFWDFLPPFVVSTLLYVASRILVPDLTTTSSDVRAHFFEINTPFFACLALVFVFASAIVVVDSGPRALVSWEGLLSALLTLLALGGAATRRPQVHAALVPIWTVLYLWQQAIQPSLS